MTENDKRCRSANSCSTFTHIYDSSTPPFSRVFFKTRSLLTKTNSTETTQHNKQQQSDKASLTKKELHKLRKIMTKCDTRGSQLNQNPL